MKKTLTFALVALVAIACVNTNKKPKGEPEAPAEQPAVEAPVKQEAPDQTATPARHETPVATPPKEETAPAEEAAPLTVDALCNQFGVYDLLDQYKQHIQNKDKKAAKQVEAQLSALRKQIKNDESLPLSLRENFKTYVEDKEEEIEERFK